MNRSGEIRITKTTVGVWEEDVDESMRETLPFVAAHFTARGWAIGADPRIDRDYPSLSRSHLAGGKAELGVYVRLCGRHLEINITTDGNRLLSDTTQAMAKSPTLRLRVLCEIASLARTLVDCGYRISARNGFHSRPVEPTLATVRNIVEGRKGTPLEQFNEDWGDNRFERDESGWPALKELTSWNKDGLTQGAWRYGRTSNGRLVYGQTFGGINGTWQLVANGVVYYVNSNFFEYQRPDLEPRRLVPNQDRRVRSELEKALKANNYGRVATLAKVLERIGGT